MRLFNASLAVPTARALRGTSGQAWWWGVLALTALVAVAIIAMVLPLVDAGALHTARFGEYVGQGHGHATLLIYGVYLIPTRLADAYLIAASLGVVVGLSVDYFLALVAYHYAKGQEIHFTGHQWTFGHART